jgi:hypothetical protein
MPFCSASGAGPEGHAVWTWRQRPRHSGGVANPSSYRPIRWGRRNDVAMDVMRATREVCGRDGQPVELPKAHPGSAYQCRLGVFRKTIVLWFVSPPAPSRLEDARRAAGAWRVKVRVNPKGRPDRHCSSTVVGPQVYGAAWSG